MANENKLNNELNLDKTKWKSVSFGEVAIQQKENVDRETTKLSRYVAGEHMGSEDLHIRNWGEINGDYLGPAFHRKFEKGDILYGSRRTYLRKVAVAHFDGITSNTTFVIKANKDLIIPDLLPFIMLSEGFAQHSIKNSKGSVNPYINFKDIASYEFLLPPKKEQARIAELLWAADEVVETDYKLIVNLNLYYKTLLKRSITQFILEKDFVIKNVKSLFQTRWENSSLPSQWDHSLLRNVLSECQTGFAEGKRERSGIAQLRMNNVTRENRLDLSEIARIPNREGISKYYLQKDDVLFNNTNSEDLVGKSIFWNCEIEQITFSNHFTRLRTNTQKLLPKYLHLWLKYHFEIGLFERRCTKWIGQAAVQTENLLSLYILLPTLKEQEYICEISNKIEKQIEKSESNMGKLISLRKSMINQIF